MIACLVEAALSLPPRFGVRPFVQVAIFESRRAELT